ncbi:MAG: MarR family winged helix-turn-helix transcriptional regulator [Endozoicomonas sp.]
MNEQAKRLYNNLLTLSWYFSDQCHSGKGCDSGECDDFSLIDFLAMRVIDKQQNCPVQAIGKALGITKSGATRVVKRLEKRGLVAMKSSTEDARIRSLCLTESGQDCMNSVNRYQADSMSELLSSMGEEKSRQFDEGLQALMAILQEKSG